MRGRIETFLAHTRADKGFTRRLGRDLTSQGVDAWFDEWAIKPGESITDRISEGLRRYDVFLIVLTPKSVSSEWVREELRVALQRRAKTPSIRIIPVLRRKCRLPEFLRDYKYVDFSNPGRYKQAFNDLCDAIVFDEKLIGRYARRYRGGLLVDCISVTARVSGPNYERASFREVMRFRGIKAVRTMRKEFESDGHIESVAVAGGSVRRRAIRRSVERWVITFDQVVGLGASSRVVISYRLRNEFALARTWYYDIQSPTRRLTFDWYFSRKHAPKRLSCTELHVPTSVRRMSLKRQDFKAAIRFSFEVDYPDVQSRFEFAW